MSHIKDEKEWKFCGQMPKRCKVITISSIPFFFCNRLSKFSIYMHLRHFISLLGYRKNQKNDTKIQCQTLTTIKKNLHLLFSYHHRKVYGIFHLRSIVIWNSFLNACQCCRWECKKIAYIFFLNVKNAHIFLRVINSHRKNISFAWIWCKFCEHIHVLFYLLEHLSVCLLFFLIYYIYQSIYLIFII